MTLIPLAYSALDTCADVGAYGAAFELSLISYLEKAGTLFYIM